MDDLLARLQPYAAAVSAAASLAFLTFLVHFIRLFREAHEEQLKAVKEQKGVAEERLKLAEEDLRRQELRYERDKAELRRQLAETLANAPSSVGALVASSGHLDVPDEVRSTLSKLLDAIGELKRGVSSLAARPSEDPEFLLDLAKAATATDDWTQAADNYRAYLASRPNDWQVRFLLAVALANTRGDDRANLEALRELNDAIALAPADIEPNVKARLYGYRGADFKRLGRLDEAEHDLQFARRFATAEYEMCDITYNLAGVYAMMRRRADMLRELNRLADRPRWLQAVRSRRLYFENYWLDPEFQRLIGRTYGEHSA